MKNIWILVFLLSSAFISCGDDDTDDIVCGTDLIIDSNRYNSKGEQGPAIFIISSVINDKCLSLTLGFSGCDDDHTIELVTDGAIAESFPVQIFFKLEDLDPQLCEAYFEKVFDYDLNELDELLGSEPQARLVFNQVGKEILWDRE